MCLLCRAFFGAGVTRWSLLVVQQFRRFLHVAESEGGGGRRKGVRENLTVPYLNLLYLALFYLTISYLIFSCSTILYLTLRYLTSPYLTLPYLTLPYLTLCYLTLPYLALLHFDNRKQNALIYSANIYDVKLFTRLYRFVFILFYYHIYVSLLSFNFIIIILLSITLNSFILTDYR